MTLNLITLDTVKEQLNILDTEYDDAITSKIPQVSADVRRMLNCQFSDVYEAVYNLGEAEFTLYDTDSIYDSGWIDPIIPIGSVIVSDEITADSYVEAYEPLSGTYTASSEFTEDGGYLNKTVNISQWAAISKMVFYKIMKSNTKAATSINPKSRSVGPLSVTLSDAEINKQWDYPQFLISDLGIPYTRVG